MSTMCAARTSSLNASKSTADILAFATITAMCRRQCCCNSFDSPFGGAIGLMSLGVPIAAAAGRACSVPFNRFVVSVSRGGMVRTFRQN
jgi:hypothetical protein